VRGVGDGEDGREREDVEGRCGVHRSDRTRLGRTDGQHSGQ
jgi:hypothetical protein